MIESLPTLVTVARLDGDGLYTVESFMDAPKGTMQPAELTRIPPKQLAERVEVLVYGEIGLIQEMRVITSTPEPRIVAGVEVLQTEARALGAPVWMIDIAIFGSGEVWRMKQHVAASEVAAVAVARGWLAVYRHTGGAPGLIPMTPRDAAAA